MSELSDQIKQNTQQPESADVDGVRAKQFPLTDQIAADLHLSEQQAAGKSRLPIQLARLRPPSAL